MKYDEIKKDLELFDDFVNKSVSANIPEINVIQVVAAYNRIRDFINKNIEKE